MKAWKYIVGEGGSESKKNKNKNDGGQYK